MAMAMAMAMNRMLCICYARWGQYDLVRFQRVNWVAASSFDGWIETENGTNGNGNDERDKTDAKIEVGAKWSNGANKEGKNIAENEAKTAAKKTENEAFKQKLQGNVKGGGTNGFSDADFMGAFGDGDEHDVHNSDAADDERDARDECEHTGDDIEEGASWM